MEPHWRRRLHVAREQPLDGAGADGGELDAWEPGGEWSDDLSWRVWRGTGERGAGATQWALVQPVRRVPGCECWIPEHAGVLSDVEYPQRSSAFRVSVVSEEERGAEFWAG